MVGLLDVNVLVALVIPVHEHHAPARQWVLTAGTHDGWATCPVTELGLIRVCAQLLRRWAIARQKQQPMRCSCWE